MDFIDPRSNREFRKVVVRDNHRNRFVLYLECRSSHGSFDFVLNVDCTMDQRKFSRSEFADATTTRYGCHVDAYEYLLRDRERVVVQQFFGAGTTMGDQYNVHGQTGAVGRGATVENSSFNQITMPLPTAIDAISLAAELATLRMSMRTAAVEIEHDQAVAHVGNAELAARKNDINGALTSLKSAGRWALDVANKIGTSVAAKAIESALGL